jgi:methionyl-tRNA synthetase
VRSCFYTTQKFYEGILPHGEVSPEVLARARDAVLGFEAAMAMHDFPEAWVVAADYVRAINQLWTQCKPYDEACEDTLRRQALVDAFHMVRTAIGLLHPIAPDGTERVREFLQVGPELWSWETIFEPLYAFTPTPEHHALKWVEPRFDFFPKHPSQFK